MENTIFKNLLIEIKNGIDKSFDYLRIYSIHRTSIDAIPEVRRIKDFPISKERKDLIPYTTFKN